MQKLTITTGYNSTIKIEVDIDGVLHVMDKEEVQKTLLKLINTQGYTVTKTNRQKYPRLTINY